MNLSELIKAYGDDDVEVQYLDQCFSHANWNGTDTRITFGTPRHVSAKGTDKFAIIVWMDREKVAEIIEAEKIKKGSQSDE